MDKGRCKPAAPHSTPYPLSPRRRTTLFNDLSLNPLNIDLLCLFFSYSRYQIRALEFIKKLPQSTKETPAFSLQPKSSQQNRFPKLSQKASFISPRVPLLLHSLFFWYSRRSSQSINRQPPNLFSNSHSHSRLFDLQIPLELSLSFTVSSNSFL